MPGTAPSVSRSMREMAKPPVTGPKETVARVCTRAGVCPACDNASDSAIEKHAAWAAPRSSSGLVPLPSSKRDL